MRTIILSFFIFLLSFPVIAGIGPGDTLSGTAYFSINIISLDTQDLETVDKSLWFSAIDSTTTEASGKVTDMSDESGNNNDLSLGSGGTNEVTYSATAINNKPCWLWDDSAHDTYHQITSDATIQDIYVVGYYSNRTDTNFDGINTLVAGTGSFGSPKITASGGNDFVSDATMNYDGNVLKNFQTSTPAAITPMNIGVYRFQLSDTVTDQFYIGGSDSTPVAWRGAICEIVALPEIADASTSTQIIEDLIEKYDIQKYSANAVFAGQSLYRRAFDLNDKEDEFITESESIGFTTANAIKAAEDSTAVHPDSDTVGNVGSWLDSSFDRSTVYTNNITDNTLGGLDAREITHVYWMQGNADRDDIQDSSITEAQFKAATEQVLDYLEEDYPNAKIIITPNVGELSLTTQAQNDAWTAINRPRWEIQNENANRYDNSGSIDLSLTDNQHFDDAGATERFKRDARLAAELSSVGTPNNPLGSAISTATYNDSANSVSINIAHEDATDFTMTDAERFEVVVDGTSYVPDTIVKDSATKFTLSGGSLAISSGDTVVLHWPAGSHTDIDKTNTFKDNATNSLPLRSAFNVSVTEEVVAFEPDDLAEINFWIDPSDTGTITKSGDEATTIDDKSGGTDATTTASTGADSGTRTINSLNALDFDKGEYYDIDVDYTSGHTIFLVLEFDDNTTVNYIRDGDNAGTIRSYLSSSSEVVLDLDNYNLTGSTALSTGQAYIVMLEATATSAAVNVDGGSDEATSASAPGLSVNWDVIGGSSFGFDGAMGEIIGYEATLSTSEKNQVGDYLADKWGTTWTDIP